MNFDGSLQQTPIQLTTNTHTTYTHSVYVALYKKKKHISN